jgi:hypothetical protein
MNIIQFLESLNKKSVIEQYPNVGFFGQQYPLSFFSRLLRLLRSAGCDIRYLDVLTIDEHTLRAQLSMSFLGERCLYWLSDLSSAKKEQSWLLAYAQSYKGPHALWFFSSKVFGSKTIEIPEVIDIQTFHILARELSYPIKENSVVGQLFEMCPTLQFEDGLKLMQYATLMSKSHNNEFITNWLNKLMSPQASLFTLSSLFFAKKSRDFFALLSSLEDEYQPVFWFSFWSEQLFRARWFIHYVRAKQVVEAKAIAYKLPFTFIKKDWQLYTCEQLEQAHSAMYTLDYRFKNGGSPEQLELFYHSFFTQ